MSDTNYVINDSPEDLNREHKVTLTEGQISTILYVLEGYINPSDDYSYDPDCREDIDNIFERLETVVNNFYNANSNPLVVSYPDVDYRELTPFEEELEIKKYIRDNPITPEKVTQTQLKSIKSNLL